MEDYGKLMGDYDKKSRFVPDANAQVCTSSSGMWSFDSSNSPLVRQPIRYFQGLVNIMDLFESTNKKLQSKSVCT